MSAANSYEIMLVFSVANGEESAKALAEKFSALIAANGTIDSVDEWGNRRLEYPINDETEAYYYLINYQSAPEFQTELDRVLKITEGVLRSMIIKKN